MFGLIKNVVKAVVPGAAPIIGAVETGAKLLGIGQKEEDNKIGEALKGTQGGRARQTANVTTEEQKLIKEAKREIQKDKELKALLQGNKNVDVDGIANKIAKDEKYNKYKESQLSVVLGDLLPKGQETKAFEIATKIKEIRDKEQKTEHAQTNTDKNNIGQIIPQVINQALSLVG